MDLCQNADRAEQPDTGWPAFVGSWIEGPGRARVLLRGDLDAAVRERIRDQLATLLDTGARFITVDAYGVTGCDPGIIDLLGAAQHRLHRRRGLLTLRGLHPCVLPAETSSHPETPGAATRDDPEQQDSPGDLDSSIVGSSSTSATGRDPTIPSPRAPTASLSAL